MGVCAERLRFSVAGETLYVLGRKGRALPHSKAAKPHKKSTYN
jgi:hypothetical protein